MVSLQDIIGGPNLCGVIQQVKSGIPNPFEAGFFTVDKVVDGDYGTFKRIRGTRQVARIAAYGSAARQRQLKGLEEVPVKLLHTIESITLPVSAYMNLLEYDNLQKQELGIQEVSRQVLEFRKLFDNLRIAALVSLIFKGALYFDADGNLLPTSAGATFTVNYQVPAGNTGQIGGIIDTTWSNTAAAIEKQIIALKTKAIQTTGYELALAYYGKNVPSYLMENSTLQRFFSRNEGKNDQYLSSGDIPNPLFGLTWRPAYNAFFEDAAGTVQPLCGDDDIAFLPAPAGDWLGWLEGTYPVPTTIDLQADAATALRSIQAKAGMFAYGRVITNPVTVEIIAGDTFLPVLKNPLAVYKATVRF